MTATLPAPLSDSSPDAPPVAAGSRPWRRLAVAIGGVAALLAGAGYLASALGSNPDGGRAAANARQILVLEHRLGLDIERAVQSSPLGDGMMGTLLAIAYAVVYWPFVVGTLALTGWVERSAFRLVRNAMLISGAIGLIVMAVYPVAPPRLLGSYADHVGDLGMLGSMAHPDALFNPNAAMPSFHVCWMVVAASGLERLARRSVRWAPPAVMVLAVLTTGNHFVLDVLAGLALAAAAWRLATPMQGALDRAAAKRRSRFAPTSDG